MSFFKKRPKRTPITQEVKEIIHKRESNYLESSGNKDKYKEEDGLGPEFHNSFE